VNVAESKSPLAFFETKSGAARGVMKFAVQEIAVAWAHCPLGPPRIEEDGHAQRVILRMSRSPWVSKGTVHQAHAGTGGGLVVKPRAFLVGVFGYTVQGFD
jgi:hypothetical protein